MDRIGKPAGNDHLQGPARLTAMEFCAASDDRNTPGRRTPPHRAAELPRRTSSRKAGSRSGKFFSSTISASLPRLQASTSSSVGTAVPVNSGPNQLPASSRFRLRQGHRRDQAGAVGCPVDTASCIKTSAWSEVMPDIDFGNIGARGEGGRKRRQRILRRLRRESAMGRDERAPARQTAGLRRSTEHR